MTKISDVFHTHEMQDYLAKSRALQKAIRQDLKIARIDKIFLDAMCYDLISYWVTSIKDCLHRNASKNVLIESYSFEKLTFLKLLGDYPNVYKNLDRLLIRKFREIQDTKYFEPIGYIFVKEKNILIVVVD